MPQLPSHFIRVTKEFSTIRRQHFMYWEGYEAILDRLDKSIESTKEYVASVPGTEYEFSLGTVAEYGSIFDDSLNRISLEYTAGAPMEELKGLYPAAVAAFEAWCKAETDWYINRHPEKQGEFVSSPFELDDIQSYLQLLRLLSLGVLFNEGAALRKIAKLLWAERGDDVVVEELLERFIPDPIADSGLQHPELYDNLICAAWAQDKTSCDQRMNQFLKSWYKSFKGAPWHDAHLRFGDNKDSPDWSNYYGYWAWEAGALAYLYQLDDTAFRTHSHYPKDLVSWARSQGPVPREYVIPASELPPTLSAMPGQICPRTGTWVTHAMVDKRSWNLTAGEKMPSATHDRGGNLVIWYWKGV